MLQIFTTQLSGKLKMLKDKNEELLEDCGRMLAQTMVSRHTVYLFASGEMASIIPQALYGSDRFENVRVIDSTCELTILEDQDIVLIFSTSSHDEAALQIARLVKDQGKSAIAVIGTFEKERTDSNLIDLSDFVIQLQASPMVPQDDGFRIGTPTALLALYAYHCLHLMTTEILAEYE